MKFLVLNGPNLNMLGIREPDQYGSETYSNLVNRINEHCSKNNYEVIFLQSNHEGDLIDKIQDAYFEKIDGIVFNPGGYTHTSIALLDAIKAVSIPTVEVHISKIEEREAYRQISYVREACIATISGKGIEGYLEAIDLLAKQIKASND
ncbi:MAG TPA: type II 3-dehydroquinate dehydratase [Clostridiaceae bacterium]|nr:type II 3-dehydroquinate dehydratase [Clostridiaceae bacterium]